MTTTPEPKDKLDTMTMQEPTSVGECAVMVNGPEDDILNWYAIDWRTAEDDVRRLRQRIFTGLLEPGAVKVARPVLRGAGHSNAPGLPGMTFGAAARFGDDLTRHHIMLQSRLGAFRRLFLTTM